MSKQRLLPLDQVGAKVRILHTIIEDADEHSPRRLVLAKGEVCTLVKLTESKAWPFYVLPAAPGAPWIGVTAEEFKYVEEPRPAVNLQGGDSADSYGYH